jgi:hypothetical protein
MNGTEITVKRDFTPGVLSQKQAAYILKTIWKDAPDIEVVKASLICQQYQLNPLMKMIFLVKYDRKKWNPQTKQREKIGEDWVTQLALKATRQIARRGHKFGYIDGPRVMTEQEQKDILGAVEPEKIWAITKIKDSDGFVYPGYGCWDRTDEAYGSDKGNTKQNMAFGRSERNAIDKMAPGELPDAEVVDDQYSPISDVPAAITEGRQEFEQQVEVDKTDLYGPEPPPPAPTGPTTADLIAFVRQNKPALKNDKNVVDWLTAGPAGYPRTELDINPAMIIGQLKKQNPTWKTGPEDNIDIDAIGN